MKIKQIYKTYSKHWKTKDKQKTKTKKNSKRKCHKFFVYFFCGLYVYKSKNKNKNKTSVCKQIEKTKLKKRNGKNPKNYTTQQKQSQTLSPTEIVKYEKRNGNLYEYIFR